MHYSYDELLRLTRYLTGSQQAVNEQLKRMIFNIVGRNQDDHAKNFAFMMDKNGIWNLSPAYDITYSNGTGYTKNHQLSLNGKTNDFTLNDILQLAKKHSIKENIAKEYLGGSYHLGGGKTGIARRMSWHEAGLTVLCSPAQKQTDRCHPDELRPFSVRENARIQSFPDDWEFVGSMAEQYKQIGNAVPVRLGEVIAKSIKKHLSI